MGDDLGSNPLGDFKQSFSFALRVCRTCYVTNDEYKNRSNSSQLKLRSNGKHCHECGYLMGHYMIFTPRHMG